MYSWCFWADGLVMCFQTREQLLKELSRSQSRVADLESALSQQGLVTHTHTHLITQLISQRLS